MWYTYFGDGPLVAAAIHDGHDVRDELQPWLAISSQDRLREEDPFTGRWTPMAPTQIVACRSRFEVDLNRPRERAVYRTPEESWGLQVWRDSLPIELVEISLSIHDRFYAHLHHLLADLVRRHGRVVVFDLHSYNHRRHGPYSPPADLAANPEVNLGTGTMDRARWEPIVEDCLHRLREFDFHGRHLDVRENVKFRGGYFPQWIHEHFPQSVCALAIEFKKFFMDEWTGIPDEQPLTLIGRALSEMAEGILEKLTQIE